MPADLILLVFLLRLEELDLHSLLPNLLLKLLGVGNSHLKLFLQFLESTIMFGLKISEPQGVSLHIKEINTMLSNVDTSNRTSCNFWNSSLDILSEGGWAAPLPLAFGAAGSASN